MMLLVCDYKLGVRLKYGVSFFTLLSKLNICFCLSMRPLFILYFESFFHGGLALFIFMAYHCWFLYVSLFYLQFLTFNQGLSFTKVCFVSMCCASLGIESNCIRATRGASFSWHQTFTRTAWAHSSSGMIVLVFQTLPYLHFDQIEWTHRFFMCRRSEHLI